MSSRVLAFSLPEEMFGEIDKALASYNATTGAATTRSGYLRLIIADRVRNDARQAGRHSASRTGGSSHGR